MTPAEELFLDQHEALHYAYMLQHTLGRDISAADTPDLVAVARRLRKKEVNIVSAFIIVAELDLLRQEQKARIAKFSSIVNFIVANWNMEIRASNEPEYATMTAEEAYTALLNNKRT
jgi:hypothetical protein